MKRARLVREGGFFSVWDLLVYAAIVLLIAALFVVFVFSDAFAAEDARGVRVEVYGEAVYTYVFGEGGSVADGWETRVEERTEGQTLLVRISLQEGWNEMIIDEGARTVAMHDADCSLRKDCTHMLPLGSGGSVITCIPHALKITPLTGEDLSQPSIG